MTARQAELVAALDLTKGQADRDEGDVKKDGDWA
jgi:hypothetical protein